MRQDIVEGVRRLIARPAFTSIAVAILAIGIGTNTAIFSAVTTLLARPLPIPDGDHVVAGLALREGFDPFGTSWLEYSAYRTRSHVFAESGLALQRSASIVGRGEPEQVRSAAVTSGYMAALGVPPAIGRALNG